MKQHHPVAACLQVFREIGCLAGFLVLADQKVKSRSQTEKGKC